MAMHIKFIDLKTKEELFDTDLLKRLNNEQLYVLIQQVGWELEGRSKEKWRRSR